MLNLHGDRRQARGSKMGKCPKCGGKLQPIEGEPRNPHWGYKEKSHPPYAVNNKPEKDEKKDYRCLDCGKFFKLTDDQFEASEI